MLQKKKIHIFIIYFRLTRAVSISYETNVTFPNSPYLEIFRYGNGVFIVAGYV